MQYLLVLCAVATIATAAITDLTDDDRQLILDLHNDYRQEQPAVYMPNLTWSFSLESEAQAWTDACYYAHQSNQEWGENIAAGTGYSSNSQAIISFFNLWVAEEIYNTDGSYSCCSDKGTSCCHLTQVVWAGTTEVGCGLSFCDELGGTTMKNAAYLACYYLPAGNSPTVECSYDWSPYEHV